MGLAVLENSETSGSSPGRLSGSYGLRVGSGERCAFIIRKRSLEDSVWLGASVRPALEDQVALLFRCAADHGIISAPQKS
jgi:hypothetical protein